MLLRREPQRALQFITKIPLFGRAAEVSVVFDRSIRGSCFRSAEPPVEKGKTVAKDSKSRRFLIEGRI